MMAKRLKVSVNDEQFSASAGDRLLDAALRQGIELPHDCRAGHCGACTVKISAGLTLGGETAEPGCVRACQAQVFSDLTVELSDLPEPRRQNARVTELHTLSKDIVEVSIKPSEAAEWVPGQYYKVKFKGFPARSFSPTACLHSGKFGDTLQFHIKQVRNGVVTPKLGTRIDVGHRVILEGPYGHAHHRPARTSRLVLAGSGTGFAPIWAIASAALNENPNREVVLVCGSRDIGSFYMSSALLHARLHLNVTIIPTLERMPRESVLVAQGTPADHLPEIKTDDIVYAAGSPKMVGQVATLASLAGASFFADPFERSAPLREPLLDLSWFSRFFFPIAASTTQVA